MMNEDKTLVGGWEFYLQLVTYLAFNLFHLLNTHYGASATQKADFGLNPL